MSDFSHVQIFKDFESVGTPEPNVWPRHFPLQPRTKRTRGDWALRRDVALAPHCVLFRCCLSTTAMTARRNRVALGNQEQPAGLLSRSACLWCASVVQFGVRSSVWFVTQFRDPRRVLLPEHNSIFPKVSKFRTFTEIKRVRAHWPKPPGETGI